MEMHLPRPFFSSVISTTVRSITSSLTLAPDRLTFRLLSALAPKRAAARAQRLFLTPPRHPFSDAELAVLEEASLLTVPMPTGKLVAWRWGRRDAPTILLAHGWGGRGAQLHHFVAPLEARGYSVVTYDAPGHGMTGGKESSIVHMSAAMQAMLAQLGPVAAVIGHSLGAAVAAHVLSKSAQAGAAVLIAPPASLTAYSKDFATLLGLSEASRHLMQRSMERRYGVAWSEFEADRIASDRACPMLVVHDIDDKENSYTDGLRYVRRWPGARMLRTEGLGHRRILRDPATIASIVDFVETSVRP